MTRLLEPADADDAAFFADLLDALRADEPHEPLPEPADSDIELIDALCAPVLALDDAFALDLAALAAGPSAQEPSSRQGDGSSGGQQSSSGQGIASSNGYEAGSGCDISGKTSSIETSVSNGDIGPAEPAAGGAEEKPKAKRRIRRSNPNKAREEQRKELLALRVQAAEMEQQLSSLRSAGVGALTQQPAGQMTSIRGAGPAARQPELQAASVHVDFAEVWRQTCLRQLERRLRAERENTKLKEQVSNQSRATNAVHKMLQGPAGANVSALSCW